MAADKNEKDEIIMKKSIIFSTILGLAMSCAALTAFADEISVEVNGKKIATDVPAQVINDRTVVPVRAISEALNCDVEWDNDTKGVNIYRENSLYMMWMEKNTAFKLSPVAIENFYDMDTPPIVINDRTMLPLRAIGELLGAQVDWNQETLTAVVNMDIADEDNDGYAQQLLQYEKSMYDMYEVYEAYVHGKAKVVNAQIMTEGGGIINLELYPEIAPTSVENFVALAKEGFYDGLTFHRVIKDFMIQGGGIDTAGVQKESENIYGEFIANGYLNLIKHERGVISMARAEHPDSASSQFFIMHKDAPHLDGAYAAFGKVTSGMEIVDEIAEVATDISDKPIKDVVIKSITIK